MRALLAAAVLGLLGCAHGSGSDIPPTSAARYFPLAVGNRWSYQATGLGSDATEQVEIRGIKDGQYEDNRGRLLWVTADGLRDQSRYLLRAPVEAGRVWTVKLTPASVERWQITSVGKRCSAPAGQFEDCVEVESRTAAASGAELVDRITFAAGVGIVRVRTFLVRQGKETPQTELKLVSYQVAPQRPPPAH